ncbi:sugar ABC transporter substrate-binding protein [Pseudohaliea rubra]|uniref:Ribose ABC transport system, periplasmic ribose-binding protein RbsB n=1 Tax=Pseudohaliea rubra DSM 19751 TaxID=1265313 RepID=A0A095VQG0_9GAMM|nr:sugar ABC transporter substrate-binding protein [Pseudohaliea rubra]KGE03682.1 Ribose ABC transport system, periplasmic ribose-binding protein RbsB [Pseudohaliea rubra DSM 19751]
MTLPRRLRAAGAACLSALFLIACGDGGEPQPESSGKPRVALIMKSLANEFFINMAAGARAHQAEHADRYELIVNGIKNESDLAQQVALVEQMMASQVDVIVIAPADSQGLLPVARRAVEQGIVVVNIDNRFDEKALATMDLRIPFVGPDNREGAYRVGLALAETLEPGDEVAIIGGIPSAFNARQRAAGFRDAMAEAGIAVVTEQAADWEQAKAATVAAAILNENPALDALLCANDSMALGAVAAVRQAGRRGGVSVVGFDNISAARGLIAGGDMFATAEQYGHQLAVFGIEYALQVLEEGTDPADRKTPVDVITAAQL